jgi:hypothetical protein
MDDSSYGAKFGGAAEDGYKSQEAIKKLSRKMGRKAKERAICAKKTKMQTEWEEETRKPETTWRDQEVLEESKKTFGVYVQLKIGFNFPSLDFLIQFSNQLCIK